MFVMCVAMINEKQPSFVMMGIILMEKDARQTALEFSQPFSVQEEAIPPLMTALLSAET